MLVMEEPLWDSPLLFRDDRDEDRPPPSRERLLNLSVILEMYEPFDSDPARDEREPRDDDLSSRRERPRDQRLRDPALVAEGSRGERDFSSMASSSLSSSSPFSSSRVMREFNEDIEELSSAAIRLLDRRMDR